MSAEAAREFEAIDGAQPQASEWLIESESRTGRLGALCAAWEDVQRTRLALDQRGIPADPIKALEDRLGRQIARELQRHPIWPWLRQFPGLGGVHAARLVAIIRDPHRFPGRLCAAGHHHPAADDTAEIDTPAGCGVKLLDGTSCAAPVGPLRRGTGVRSLWHYLGLHVVEGRLPRRTKGQRADWTPAGRTAVLMPGGIADQIVRQRVPVYRERYDREKERLTRERADARIEIERPAGPLPIYQAEADDRTEIDRLAGLRPFQIEQRARIIAAKAFLGDLLMAWKHTQPVED